MTLLRRLTVRGLPLALLALLMLAGSAAASTVSESGTTLTITASVSSGGPQFVMSYTDPTTDTPTVFLYGSGGDSAGQGCASSHSGEVTICDATGLTSIVLDSQTVSDVTYTAYESMTPLPVTVDYDFPISNHGVTAGFNETPAGQSSAPGGPWGLIPAGTTTAAPFTINDNTPPPAMLNGSLVGAVLNINSGDGHATINGGNAQGNDFTVGAGGATITTTAQPTAMNTQPTTVNAQNGAVDTIVCNSDQDIVHADPQDIVTGTCGTLDTGGPPAAALSTSDSAPLTGQQTTFDASGSTDRARSITDYSWDFDGSGFNTDTGSTPSASHTYTTPGNYTASVRITDNAGQTSVQSMTVHVTPAPPAGAVGVSIDDGLIASSAPNVTLDLVWPAGATSAEISNDGGFGAAGSTETIAVSPTVAWTLESSGPERLPKTVYVRFLGAGSDTTPYTDDIILDQTVPVIASAQLTGAATATDTPQLVRTYLAAMPMVQLSASDVISGITTVQFADASSTVTDALVAPNSLGQYSVQQAMSVGLATPTRVRVQNAAGTWSGWTAIAQAAATSPSPAVPTRCIVPRLAGKTLAQSKKLLKRAHCAVGHVRKPKHAHHVLRVKHQSPQPGVRDAAGHRVSLTTK